MISRRACALRLMDVPRTPEAAGAIPFVSGSANAPRKKWKVLYADVEPRAVELPGARTH